MKSKGAPLSAARRSKFFFSGSVFSFMYLGTLEFTSSAPSFTLVKPGRFLVRLFQLRKPKQHIQAAQWGSALHRPL
jgi:hypothetical protein